MLKGRVALVTGGGRGIGGSISRALAQAGALVAINFLGNREAAEATRVDIERAGGHAQAFAADVSQPEQVQALFAAVAQALGPVQVLVNNAGLAEKHHFGDASPTLWRRMIEVNLDAAFYCTQAALPSMRAAGWGRIVNVSSGAIYRGGIVGPGYAAAKAGLVTLSRSAARDLAPFGITVNTVIPALIESDMLSVLLPDAAARERALREIPLGRFGYPDEVATVVRFLCDEAPAYLTGAAIDLAGGR